MSVNVDTKKLREALEEFSSETVVIPHSDLMNLITRVERGEQLRSDLDAWFAELPQKLAR